MTPRTGRSPGKRNDNPLQYSYLGNPTEEAGGLQPMGSQESDIIKHTHTYTLTKHIRPKKENSKNTWLAGIREHVTRCRRGNQWPEVRMGKLTCLRF